MVTMGLAFAMVFSGCVSAPIPADDCILEGEQGVIGCCEGLTPVSCADVVNGECLEAYCGNRCTKCGNGECGLGENWCNCPADCPKE